MNERHVQSGESFDRISDGALRQFVRQAIGRAADIDWSFLVALHDGQGDVICFDASLPPLISEFLCGCARFALPRGPAPVPSFEDEPEFVEIADVELRGAMERAVARAQELNIFCFFDLWIASQGSTEEQFHFCYAGRLPWEIAEHLHLCFFLATVASWKGEESGVELKRWRKVGLVN